MEWFAYSPDFNQIDATGSKLTLFQATLQELPGPMYRDYTLLLQIIQDNRIICRNIHNR